MRLTLRDELPFVTVQLTHDGATIDVPDVLVDTGAASTVINADIAATVGILLRKSDRLRTLRGVGGREYVFVRNVDRLSIGQHGRDDFEVEIGEMDYGFEFGGILGMDFLTSAGAIIDLRAFSLDFTP